MRSVLWRRINHATVEFPIIWTVIPPSLLNFVHRIWTHSSKISVYRYRDTRSTRRIGPCRRTPGIRAICVYSTRRGPRTPCDSVDQPPPRLRPDALHGADAGPGIHYDNTSYPYVRLGIVSASAGMNKCTTQSPIRRHVVPWYVPRYAMLYNGRTPHHWMHTASAN